MENKNLKIAVYIFVCMVGFGLGLIAVSIFMSFIDVKTLVPMPGSSGTYNASLDLFDAEWGSMDASPVFVILSYLVLIVGLIITAIDASIRQKLKRKIKGLNYAGLAVSVIGFVLFIVAVIITKNDVAKSMNNLILQSAITAAGGAASEQELMLAIQALVHYNLGIGTIMTIIGSVVAIIGSILLVIPAFDPIKLAAQPAATAPTAPATPAEPAPNTEANDNNDTIA
ncbi:MAG: hypothetical protein K2O39_04580 [Clostridiales bacterium]|nr:hypothetical protein [Clostridiales bacterium]